jgi:AcrR family transcriptional regulator
MVDPNSKPIKDSILNAAELLFAKNGYEAASLRQITTEAKVNLAAVNYHFGDKESLYREVIFRRLRPINQTRLTLLEKAEQESGDQPIPLAKIFELLGRPVFELGQYASAGHHHAVRVLGRSLSEPQPFMTALIAQEIQPVMARFAQAVRRHVPAMSPEEFLWHYSFVVGAMQHALSTMHNMKELTRGICRDHDSATALRHFTQFAVATFTSSPNYGK